MKIYPKVRALAGLQFANTLLSALAIGTLSALGLIGHIPIMLGTMYILLNAVAFYYLIAGSSEIKSFEEAAQKVIQTTRGQQGIDDGLAKLARIAKSKHAVMHEAGLNLATLHGKDRYGANVYNHDADPRIKDAYAAQQTFDEAVRAVKTLGHAATPSVSYYLEKTEYSLPLPQSTDDALLQQPGAHSHPHIRKVT
jgi:hypothetical protein